LILLGNDGGILLVGGQQVRLERSAIVDNTVGGVATCQVVVDGGAEELGVPAIQKVTVRSVTGIVTGFVLTDST
jgi:hypothetical protein